MNSADARGVIQRPDRPRLATTDFYQAGAAWNTGRLSLTADTFLIDHSNEQVYIPDDGTIEFKGPTRAYGYEGKASFHINRYVSVNTGLTKVSNALYRGGAYRIYVDSAPHLVANAALTFAGWRGWSGSVRMRAINHYRLDGEDPSILASGNTVFDLSGAKTLNRHVELNFSLENFTNRSYYETQNYFKSRVAADAPAVTRIHATPGYPLTAIGGITFRFGGK
jgi:outer membrane receptor protein involved in Fe transport